MESSNTENPSEHSCSDSPSRSTTPELSASHSCSIGTEDLPSFEQFEDASPVPSLPKPMSIPSRRNRSKNVPKRGPKNTERFYRVGQVGRVRKSSPKDSNCPELEAALVLPPDEIHDSRLFRKVG
jgi:hypothetical protein